MARRVDIPASMVAVATEANPLDDPADAAALGAHAEALVTAVAGALPGWVAQSVAQRYREAMGREPPPAVASAAADAGDAALAEVEPALRTLLALDVDEQRSNPLALVRSAVRHPTGVLRVAAVPPVERDEQARRLFPDDDYDLTPASFADLGPDVQDPGIAWGAAKAHVILRRRSASAD